MKYVKKPVVVEAIQWDGKNTNDVLAFGPGKITYTEITGSHLMIFTLEGTMTAIVGDWIIKGIKGEFYPCKPDIFEASYEAVTDPPAPPPPPVYIPPQPIEGS